MKLLPCRECAALVSDETSECPGCGCRTPFSCSVCAKPLSAVSLGVAVSRKNPHGAFSSNGEPLCHTHRLTRCHHCESVFPQEEMSRHVVGKHADRVLREGKTPRIEPVFGYFCRSCESAVPTSVGPISAASRPWVLGLAILATAAIVAAYILR